MGITPDYVLDKLKRAAKAMRKVEPSLSQSEALDKVAVICGYNNWSLLHKDVQKKVGYELSAFHENLYGRPRLEGILPSRFSGFDPKEAADAMKDWVETNYTRLVEFAYYDNESSNGYAWPDEDINNALQEEFGQVYPLELIEEVAANIELDGPWGIEDYGDE